MYQWTSLRRNHCKNLYSESILQDMCYDYLKRSMIESCSINLKLKSTPSDSPNPYYKMFTNNPCSEIFLNVGKGKE